MRHQNGCCIIPSQWTLVLSASAGIQVPKTCALSFATKMSLLYQVRYLVRLSQIVGAIPYSMEVTRTNGKETVRFRFSWLNLTSWWFAMIMVITVTSPFISHIFFMDIMRVWQLPRATLVITSLVSVSFFFLIFASRWIVLQPRKWGRIISLVYKIDGILADDNLLNDIKGIKKSQIWTSVILATGLVFGCLVTSVPLQIELFRSMGFVVLSLAISFQAILWLIIMCGILIIYFSYLLLNRYLASLSKVFLGQTSCNFETLFRRATKNFEKGKILLNYLCEATAELNSLLAFPVFLILTTAFINSVVCLYLTIRSFVSPNTFLSYIQPCMAVLFSINLMTIYVLLRSPDMLAYELKQQKEILMKWYATCTTRSSRISKASIMYSSHYLSVEDIKMPVLIMQFNEDRFRLSALGLFNVGLHLIPSLTGAVVTYLVILMQQV